MRRILIAWELGGGYGHVAELRPLALALKARGIHVSFALPRPAPLAADAKAHGFALVRAPMPTEAERAAAGSRREMLVSYPAILQAAGWGDHTALTRLVRDWRAVIAEAQPDLVLAEHAPTAVLAARLDRLPVAMLGTGFSVPPRRTPMPSAGLLDQVPEAELQARESAVLAVANQVLVAGGGAPTGSLAALFAVAPALLRTWPELDHYGAREDATYWGPLADPEQGEVPVWPDGPGAKVFAYLSGAYESFAPLMRALALRGLPTLAHVRDLPPTAMTQWQARSLLIAPKPVRVDAALAQAAIVVSHAGHGLTAAALRAGRPVLAYPMNAEQTMMARRLARQGLGRFVLPGGSPDYFLASLVSGLDDRSFAHGVASFAALRRDHDRAASIDALADRIVELSSGSERGGQFPEEPATPRH